MIGAVWVVATQILTVFFDQPLQPVAQTPANWTLRVNLRNRSVDAPAVSGSNVVSPTTQVGGIQSGTFVTYAASPPELFGLSGVPVEPFSHSPVFAQF